MEVAKVITTEDRIRGPVVRFNQAEGMTINDCMEAVDECVVPQMVIVYEELTELINGLEPRDIMKASDYLSVMRNALTMLTRIQEEARNYFHKRIIENLKGGNDHE